MSRIRRNVIQIHRVGKIFEKLNGGIMAAKTTAKICPVTGVQIFSKINASGREPGKQIQKSRNNIAANVRTIVKNNIEKSLRERPVHKFLIGSAAQMEINVFWKFQLQTIFIDIDTMNF
ncbi:hypothetical protein AGMMS49545_10910 [Betaproteobacteria bacterium]|nr:hypothetical protein AGMMS49545_10910 [Betaproteobacteria bacterium]GHU44558.1 hypothetical protein AGMMS50289_13120 [Betaproteobacteria bacterium]